jgi:cation diffusion facilitator family transporter
MLNSMKIFKGKLDSSNCQNCGRRVAWVGIWVNVLMVVMKLIVGVVSGSKACIADGLHSASNIITAFAIMVSQKINARKSTSQFPNGYGKVEFMAAGFITLLIISGAVALLLVSIRHLVNQPSAPPHWPAMLMAVLSIGINEMMFRYMRCVGTQLKSQTILANAWANRADCFSSIAVIIGVLGARMGLHHLDPIAAIFVVGIIIRVSYKILRESINALMDASANDIYGEEIIRIVSNVKEIHGVENLRTRHIGQKIWAEIDVLIDGRANMEEAQRVARKVKDRLYANIGDLERVMVNCGCFREEKC